jgi:uncharacterized damage-inducible protein DinB
MSMADALLPEFDHEMATTRRVLERVPSEKADFKPHPKSFSLAHLSLLISGMPGWLTRTLRETELDLGKFAGYSNQKTETLLASFDKNVKEAREAIASTSDADFMKIWKLTGNGQVYLSMPRAAAVRSHINHLIHHRGQLSVYLRLIDVPVPSIYGPTADERM